MLLVERPGDDVAPGRVGEGMEHTAPAGFVIYNHSVVGIAEDVSGDKGWRRGFRGGGRALLPGMQTFLPFPDFTASARVLDDRRLGSQRMEGLICLRACIRPGYGWRHHPAAKMWNGHEEALARYVLEVCAEWTRRGFADTVAASVRAEVAGIGVRRIRTQPSLARAGRLPSWFGDDRFHRAHQSNLLRKLPDHYGPLLPAGVPADLDYEWPSRWATEPPT